MPNEAHSDSEGDYEQTAIEFIRTELTKATPTNRRRIIEKFILAALGSIPWVGGFISAAAAYKAEEASIRTDNLQTQWLQEHARKISQLMRDLENITNRLDSLGEQIDDRIQSEDYLNLVRQGFRTWDRADTDEKRKYIGNIVSNAAGTRLCSDDVVRLFIDWLNLCQLSVALRPNVEPPYHAATRKDGVILLPIRQIDGPATTHSGLAASVDPPISFHRLHLTSAQVCFARC